MMEAATVQRVRETRVNRASADHRTCAHSTAYNVRYVNYPKHAIQPHLEAQPATGVIRRPDFKDLHHFRGHHLQSPGQYPENLVPRRCTLGA
jgi:hypothetical protein